MGDLRDLPLGLGQHDHDIATVRTVLTDIGVALDDGGGEGAIAVDTDIGSWGLLARPRPRMPGRGPCPPALPSDAERPPPLARTTQDSREAMRHPHARCGPGRLKVQPPIVGIGLSRIFVMMPHPGPSLDILQAGFEAHEEGLEQWCVRGSGMGHHRGGAPPGVPGPTPAGRPPCAERVRQGGSPRPLRRIAGQMAETPGQEGVGEGPEQVRHGALGCVSRGKVLWPSRTA